jgi:hypothetical protein
MVSIAQDNLRLWPGRFDSKLSIRVVKETATPEYQTGEIWVSDGGGGLPAKIYFSQ